MKIMLKRPMGLLIALWCVFLATTALAVIPNDNSNPGWPAWHFWQHTTGQTLNLTYRLSTGLADTSPWWSAAQTAADRWNAAGTLAKYTYDQSAGLVTVSHYWAADNSNAKATPYLIAGYMSHCDIDGNESYSTKFTTSDFEQVAGHEMGHCIGLGHANGSTYYPIMWYAGPTSTTSPTPIDINGVNSMYP